jgi:polyphosphate kinase
VEAVVPVADVDLRSEVEQFLELELADDTLAWELAGDGSWHKVAAGHGVNTQRLMQRATLGIVESEGAQAI